MKKQLLDFDLKKFNSNQYDVITRSMAPVKIAGCLVEKNETTILGKVQGSVAQWDERGRYFGHDNNIGLDLLLTVRPKVKYVNVIKSKKGMITARVTDYKAYIQSGNELLAQYELLVEESPNQLELL